MKTSNTLKNTVAALSLVFLPVAASAQDGEMLAKAVPTNISPEKNITIQPEYSVPFRSFADQRQKFVKRVAAGASDDSIIVVFFGDNQEMLNAARLGASRAKNRGYPVNGMLHGPGNNEVFIYADGQKIELNNKTGKSVTEQTENTITWAYDDVVLPRKTAKVQPTASHQ